MSFCNSLTFFRIWTSAKTQPISSVMWQSPGAHLVNINVYAKFHHNIPLSSRDSAIIFFFSEFGVRQSPDQWKMSFRNLLGKIALISMFTQKFIKIFHSVQEIGLFSLFQNLNLGNASANPKWHLTIPWATSCQYQCICKILSKYSKRFKSYRHFSQTGRGQNLHKQSKDKIFTNSPRTKSSQTVRWQNQMFDCRTLYEINFKFQLTFLGSCNNSLQKNRIQHECYATD